MFVLEPFPLHNSLSDLPWISYSVWVPIFWWTMKQLSFGLYAKLCYKGKGLILPTTHICGLFLLFDWPGATASRYAKGRSQKCTWWGLHIPNYSRIFDRLQTCSAWTCSSHCSPVWASAAHCMKLLVTVSVSMATASVNLCPNPYTGITSPLEKCPHSTEMFFGSVL